MYLINTKTLKLEHFVDERAQRYAILSHRWEEEEVTFAHINANADFSSLKGYYKLRKCCEQASQDKLEYAWIDTCCIDKSSSAELQEAINSMFRWYKTAVTCYVYLSDIEESEHLPHSQWLTRGWTLQELIAPDHVEFYNYRWDFIGEKASFASTLSEITRIPKALLCTNLGDSLRDYSIAEKMSWASGRVTTRIEDRAYSLLGIFDVNMPMLYGEGDKAFIRLQEEILRRSSDQSILAWTGVSPHSFDVLATSPNQFSYLQPQKHTHPWFSQHAMDPVRLQLSRRGAHSMTNEGLTLELELLPWRPNVFLALLNHKGRVPSNNFPASKHAPYQTYYGIFLLQVDADMRFVRIQDDRYGDLYVYPRDKSNFDYVGERWERVRERSRVLKITIVQSLMADEVEGSSPDHVYPFPGFILEPGLDQDWSSIPWEGTRIKWNRRQRLQKVKPSMGQYGAIVDLYPSHDGYIKGVTVGIDFWCRPVIYVRTLTSPLEDWKHRDEAICQWDRPERKLFTVTIQFSELFKQVPCGSIKECPLPSAGAHWTFVFDSGRDKLGKHIISIYLSSQENQNATCVMIQMERKYLAEPWLLTVTEKTRPNDRRKCPIFDWAWAPSEDVPLRVPLGFPYD